MITHLVFTAVAAWASLVHAARLAPIEVRGTAFVAGGERFYIRGLDYQPGGSSSKIDPLSNPSVCRRDIERFVQLGINAIRVYMVDNSKKHDECMKLLDEAGIYLILDVNTPGYSINREQPKKSYNTKYLQSVFSTVQKFAKYNNTLAFFSGNEVVNDDPGTEKSAPYVKAVTRDIKNYMRVQGLRAVPVGYSAADVSSNVMQQADYFNCGSDDMRADFFAFNDYSFCNSNFKGAGWDVKVKAFSDYGLPIFLSEFGCIRTRPRKFEEIKAMMSPEMTPVYSGGLLYEYSEESNEYGIVKIKGENVETTTEFEAYSASLKSSPPPGNGGASPTTHARTCPTRDEAWDVDPSLVPEMPSPAEKWMKSGITQGPGLRGFGSQEAADSGTATRSVTSGVPSPVGTTGGKGAAAAGAGEDEEDGAEAWVRPGMTAMAVTGLVVSLTLLGFAVY
ncbi:1,3-beta-glucanosyltransferase gel1 [Ophiocordyceps camponoti-floridani]|uniref:1,3-beta-glucanosyltransferase n=1 Tax=Ophiocordyceps camponoti-floridani TaxID=2030778 RepID=A0A8H4Q1U5_9HYPO|nr:1,3-beta-glucanosyltransferase gel1 [Ophiocordyceps camponoti-floridani]